MQDSDRVLYLLRAEIASAIDTVEQALRKRRLKPTSERRGVFEPIQGFKELEPLNAVLKMLDELLA